MKKEKKEKKEMKASCCSKDDKRARKGASAGAQASRREEEEVQGQHHLPAGSERDTITYVAAVSAFFVVVERNTVTDNATINVQLSGQQIKKPSAKQGNLRIRKLIPNA